MPGNACSRSEEHTSELQSPPDLVCRLLLEKTISARVYGSGGSVARATSLRAFPFRRRVCCSRVAALACSARRTSHVRPLVFFFFKVTTPPEIYPLPLPDALPI